MCLDRFSLNIWSSKNCLSCWQRHSPTWLRPAYLVFGLCAVNLERDGWSGCWRCMGRRYCTRFLLERVFLHGLCRLLLSVDDVFSYVCQLYQHYGNFLLRQQLLRVLALWANVQTFCLQGSVQLSLSFCGDWFLNRSMFAVDDVLIRVYADELGCRFWIGNRRGWRTSAAVLECGSCDDLGLGDCTTGLAYRAFIIAAVSLANGRWVQCMAQLKSGHRGATLRHQIRWQLHFSLIQIRSMVVSCGGS